MRRLEHQSHSPVGEEAPEQFVIVIFDDEPEYVRFTDYVYEAFRGAGLGLTDVPVPQSVRVAPWLLEKAEHEQFTFRRFEEKDRACAEQSLRGRRPFDVEAAQSFPIPGNPSSVSRRTQR